MSAREVRVFAGGVLEGHPMASTPVIVIDAPVDLRSFLELLEVVDVPDAICMCRGDTAVEFFDSDGARLAIVGLHHAQSLRWEAWSGDARLAHGRDLVQWLLRVATRPRLRG
jgi:hypothetical protein